MAARTRQSSEAAPFYEQALSQAERADFPAALAVEGLDQEIAVLRLRLRTALQKQPEDLQLMSKGIAMLVRAVAARYRLPKADQDALAEALADSIEGDIWKEVERHDESA
ncbi:MAG TPA: hypothetical protein VG845_08305 [Dehalococcoidia bacterium]|jgi:hypothetical protein|nr:hypothetical protein [Dehalococcoidia bacterium]